MRILIIDDEKAIVDLCEVFFRKKGGYIIDKACCGSEALRLIKENIYNVVIMDKKMPDIDGEEMVQYIRERGTNTKVIILPGSMEMENDDNLEKKAEVYLTKPVGLDELQKIIDELAQE